MTSNSIEKHIDLKAPLARVWRALTDHKEFGQWFGVELNEPFALGQPSTGHMTACGHEHIKLQATIVRMEPQTLFAYTWHPFALDPAVDYSGETPTLVEFHLQANAEGTHLRVLETGFDQVPAHRRDIAFRAHEQGWTMQMQNVEKHVSNR